MHSLHIYLNHDLIAEKKLLDLAEVQEVIADEIAKVKGVAFAVSSSDIAANRVPDTHVMQLIKNNHYPVRSGDVCGEACAA